MSSGAVGMGCQVLGIAERPDELAKKQALAAVGQGALLRLYNDLFSSLSLVRPLSPLNCAAGCVTARTVHVPPGRAVESTCTVSDRDSSMQELTSVRTHANQCWAASCIVVSVILQMTPGNYNFFHKFGPDRPALLPMAFHPTPSRQYQSIKVTAIPTP